MNLATIEKPQQKNVFEAILARRSVRAYAPEELDRNTVQTLLEAAVRAPTAMHEEPWAFAVVQDRQLLKQLSDLAKPIFVEEARHWSAQRAIHLVDNFTGPDLDIFHGAGTLIIICTKRLGSFETADCWLAAENLMLAACSMGLGSCIIGTSVAAMNTREGKMELGIPDEYSAIVPIILGVPNGETTATSRNEPLILAWKQ
jgi:nitroreductase